MPSIARRMILALSLGALASLLPLNVVAQPNRSVGNLRIGDAQGNAVGVVPDAGPGEKVHRLDSEVSEFQVWLDYQGSGVTPVQVRMMAPQGVILDQQELELETAGSYSLDFNFDPPLDDDEYVVNAYVGDSGYLADSLQLLVGEAELIPADVSNASEIAVDPAAGQSAAEGNAVANPAEGVAGGAAASNAEASPLGPSPLLLVLAGLGVLVLLGLVAWAGMSALRTT